MKTVYVTTRRVFLTPITKYICKRTMTGIVIVCTAANADLIGD